VSPTTSITSFTPSPYSLFVRFFLCFFLHFFFTFFFAFSFAFPFFFFAFWLFRIAAAKKAQIDEKGIDFFFCLLRFI
jgi:hypothetical protein